MRGRGGLDAQVLGQGQGQGQGRERKGGGVNVRRTKAWEARAGALGGRPRRSGAAGRGQRDRASRRGSHAWAGPPHTEPRGLCKARRPGGASGARVTSGWTRRSRDSTLQRFLMCTARAAAAPRAPLGSQVSLLDTSATSHQALQDGVPHTGSPPKNGLRAAREGAGVCSAFTPPDCETPSSRRARLLGAVPERSPPHTSMAAEGPGASGLVC